MKLSNKQAYLLLHLLQDTLTMNMHGYLSTPLEFRTALLNEILNQQDERIINLEMDVQGDCAKTDCDKGE